MQWTRLLLSLVLGAGVSVQSYAQTGTLSGRVLDAETGESLPGVNVSLADAYLGAATDEEGYYQIIGVRPGRYDLSASYVGYETTTVAEVLVRAGLTTHVDVALATVVVEGDAAVVTARRPIIQPDLSASVAEIDPDEYAFVPVAGIDEVIDLQAGIEPGMRIRGGDIGEVALIIDGLNMRTGRDQEPFINIPYTSLEQVQVQTGGFNAEYGNLRAGLVNASTKNPSSTRYSLDGLFRYRPVQEKSSYALGTLPKNAASCGFDTGDINPACNTWWTRPHLDPEVAYDGTNRWDPYIQRQYQVWDGWHAAADRLQRDGFDVEADDLVDYYLYTHRKDNAIQVPDVEADVTLGGPLIPGLSRTSWDLRFLASYRGTQQAYVIPQDRNHYGSETWQLKLSANPRPTIRLSFQSMVGTERGITGSNEDRRIETYDARIPTYPWDAAPYALAYDSERGRMPYSDAFLGGAHVDHTMFAGSFMHTVNANTFYEVSITSMTSKYRHTVPPLRDGVYICPPNGLQRDGATRCSPGRPIGPLFTDNFGAVSEAGQDGVGVDRDGDGWVDVRCFGGSSDLNNDGARRPYCVGEEPLGLAARGGNLLTGESTGGWWDMIRDTTDVGLFTGKIDLTSQLLRTLQVKAGLELTVGGHSVNRIYQVFQLGEQPAYERWDRSPIQGGAYVQGKIESEGMIANLGLRADYFDANSPWWRFSPYDQALRQETDRLDAAVPSGQLETQLFLSPRLGVSFPIAENSKMYFNYGHFRQMLQAFEVFGVQFSPDGGIDDIGNPDAPMPRTVAYELGFDRNILDRFLLRISGFYRDITAQPREVTYIGLGSIVQYDTREPWNYEDIRGFEVSLSKHSGRFLRGFANYTFTRTKEGNFGYSRFYENSFDMLNYLRATSDYRQSTPITSPYARFHVILLTPVDFGPGSTIKPLDGWRLSLLGEWRAGAHFTWTGGGGEATELNDNVQWRDYWNWDARLTKHLDTRYGDLQLFVDWSNVFNRRHIWGKLAFITVGDMHRDWDFYLRSLHLPEDIFNDLPSVDETLPFSERTGLPYLWVPGDDQPGDFRTYDVPFQPVEAVSSLGRVAGPNTTAWYWAKDTGIYHRWTGDAWEDVPRNEVERVLDTKAYIDMPNLRFKTFMNPRSIRLGLRVRL